MGVAVGGAAVAVSGRAFPTNRGGLCAKGWSAGELINHPDRLTQPLVRASLAEPLRPCSWEEALDRAADGILRCQDRFGRDAVGVFGGGGLTNEKGYLLGKFARVALRTANIDYNGRFCMSSAAAAGMRAFGLDRSMPFPLEDIAGARTILLVGSNVAETMPPVMHHFAEQHRRGGSLIVADPRRTATADTAQLHLQITPGTDLALANGLLHVAIREGVVDSEFVEARTTGFRDVARAAASYWPDRVERLTGVSVGQMRQAVRMLAGPEPAMILSGRGPEQQAKGTDNTLAWINLALALGQAGRAYSGFCSLTGQGNGQGGREHGLKADQLPGYRRIDDPAARDHVAGVWGVAASSLPGPGRSAFELLDTLGAEGGVRALFVMGSNPAVSAPSVGRIRRGLAGLDLLCVSDSFLSETAQLAHVVLPCAQWAEEDGTVTNLEGRVILRRAAAAPPPEVRTDLEILSALACRLGSASGFPSDPRTVFDELRRASAGGPADYAGITWDRISASEGVFWPCPDESHPGTPRLFLDRFATPDGRARFVPVSYRPPAEEPDEEFPLWLTTGRTMQHYQSGNQTRRVAALAGAEPRPYVEVHPHTAGSLGVGDHDAVQVRTRRGSTVVAARLTASIRADTLFAPFHWPGEGSANLLTNPALDPTSKMPEFKVCAARLEAVGTATGPERSRP